MAKHQKSNSWFLVAWISYIIGGATKLRKNKETASLEDRPILLLIRVRYFKIELQFKTNPVQFSVCCWLLPIIIYISLLSK